MSFRLLFAGLGVQEPKKRKEGIVKENIPTLMEHS
jgi:hypothetical protein